MKLFKKSTDPDSSVVTEKKKFFKKPNITKASFKPTKKKVKIFLALVLLIAACIGLYVLFFVDDEQIALTDFTSYGDLSTVLEGTGTTTPYDSQSVTFPSDADILEVYVSAGDTVTIGQPLYVQDDSEVDDAIEEYQDTIDDYNDTIDDYNDSLSDLAENMADCSITADFDGKISDISIEVGDDVNNGTFVATLIDDSKMTVTQYYGYEYEDQIYVGMDATLSVPDQMMVLNGTISEIKYVNYITSVGNSCFAVTIEVVNPGSLTENMSVASYLNSSTGETIFPAEDGTLEYYNETTISAGISSEVLGVYVDDYEEVYAGQLLFSLDSSDYSDSYTSIQSKIVSAEDRIEYYQEKIEEAEESREDYAVCAEIDGRVIMINAYTSRDPSEGQTAVVIYDLEKMEFTANIDELDIENITMNMPVTVTYSTSSNTVVYEAYVSEISYEATNSNGVAYFPITVEIPSDSALSSGVNVSYSIDIGDTGEGVLVPLDALKSTTEGTAIFVKSTTPIEGALELGDDVVPDGFYAIPITLLNMNTTYALVEGDVTEGMEVFTRYQTTAPSGGDTTSDSGETEMEMGMMMGMEMGMSSGMPSGMPSGMSGPGGR